jgi:hypothetical protein
LPPAVRVCQREYDERSAELLEEIADAIEGKQTSVRLTSEGSLGLLDRVLGECRGPESERFPAGRVDSFITLLRGIDRLTASLAKEIATEFRSG